jgi:hypothetical protein
MTIIDTLPATDREAAHRAAYTAGLRALADVLDGHPEVPLPYHGNGCEISVNFLSGTDPRARMAAAARAFPCTWHKDAWETPDGSSAYFDLRGELGGLRLKLSAYRSEVCERVVTGTREVTETVPDPEALAAVPEVEVTRVIEDVEWRCHSILAPATEAEGTEAA